MPPTANRREQNETCARVHARSHTAHNHTFRSISIHRLFHALNAKCHIQMQFCGANTLRSSFVQTSNVCKMHKVWFTHTMPTMNQNHGVFLSFTLDNWELAYSYRSFVAFVLFSARSARSFAFIYSFVRYTPPVVEHTFAFSLLPRVAVYRCSVGQTL